MVGLLEIKVWPVTKAMIILLHREAYSSGLPFSFSHSKQSRIDLIGDHYLNIVQPKGCGWRA